MKNFNLLRFVLRAATALSVLTLSAALFASSSPPAWGDQWEDQKGIIDIAPLISPLYVDYTSFATFMAITNTSTSANPITITIDWNNGKGKQSKTVAPGSTCILSSASGLSKAKEPKAKGPLGTFGTFYTPPSLFYGHYSTFSMVSFALWKKKNDKEYSAFPIKVVFPIKEVDETGTNVSLSIIKADKKIAKTFVDTFNKKRVADKDVRKVGENILKTDPAIGQLLKDRAKLYKKIAKQSKSPDTPGKLPNAHTITITVSRDKAKVTGGGGTVVIGGGTKDVTITGGGPTDDTIDGGKNGKKKKKEKKTVTDGEATASGKLPNAHTITITVTRAKKKKGADITKFDKTITELIQVFSIFGNNPWDPQDPTGGGDTGRATIQAVEIMVPSLGKTGWVPLSCITGGAVETHAGGCDCTHLHDTITIKRTGDTIDDPNPFGCGHGCVELKNKGDLLPEFRDLCD